MAWRATKAKLVGLSTAETEADAAVATCKIATFTLDVTRQMRLPPCQWVAAFPPPKIPIYIDNQAAIAIMSKSTRGRNRHIDIRLKFLQSGITTDMFDFVYIPSADNDSDIGTKVLPLPIFRKLRAFVTGERADSSVRAMLAQITPTGHSIDIRDAYHYADVADGPEAIARRIFPQTPSRPRNAGSKTCSGSGRSSRARPRRAGGVLELPKSTYQSPASVASAIDEMADVIMASATQKAKDATEEAGLCLSWSLEAPATK